MAHVPTTRLLVLAVVRIMQPVHGYDVRRELLSWHAEDWANVKPGSVYGALNTLQRDGLLAAQGVEQRKRPDRTQYHITAEGEKEFALMLRESIWSAERPKHPYLTAVSLFPFLPRDDVMAALRGRILKFDAELEYLNREVVRVLAGSGNPAESVPHHVAEGLRLMIAHVEADRRWSEDTLRRIETGELDSWAMFKPE